MEAHKLVDAVIAEKPRNVDARLAKARMLLGDGKADEAAVHAKEAVKLEPESPASQYTLGLSAMARNDTTGAEQAFQEVLRSTRVRRSPASRIARLRLARGETAGAVHAAEEVSRERPDDVEAAVLLSRSLRAQGDVQRAQRELSARISRAAGPGCTPS